MPADAYTPAPEGGVKYKSVFRDTGAPYTNFLRPIDVEPTVSSGGFDAAFRMDLPDFRNRFPLLDRGFEPQDADLKLGPVYFKLRALTAAVLYSDNIEREEDDREADAIGIVRLAGTVVAQLTEGLRVAASGSFVWLPFEGDFGIAGFPLIAPYTFGLEGNTGLESQFAWDTMIGGWNVVFADDFRINTGRFTFSDRDDFEIFDGGDFDEVDRAGRYSFRAPRRSGRGQSDREDDTDIDLVYLSNVASVTTERLLPGPIRMRVRAYHENLWYNQGNRGQPELRDGDYPSRRDGLSFLLKSERDNMRFKPFLSYHVSSTDSTDGWNHQVRIGVDGPITEQLKLHLDAGWFHRTSTGSDRLLYRFGLYHRAGPYTHQSILIERQYNDLSDEILDHATYHIHQILGPKLTADAYASIGTSEDLGDDGSNREQFRAGLRFTAYPGPRTTARLGYTFSHITFDQSDDDEAFDRNTHTVRLELAYRWTDTLQSRFIYQYQQRESNRDDDSYYENLIFVTLSKYFD